MNNKWTYYSNWCVDEIGEHFEVRCFPYMDGQVEDINYVCKHGDEGLDIYTDTLDNIISKYKNSVCKLYWTVNDFDYTSEEEKLYIQSLLK